MGRQIAAGFKVAIPRRRPMLHDHLKHPTAIGVQFGAIFVSLELSRKTWLITSLSPGKGEKMSKHRRPVILRGFWRAFPSCSARRRCGRVRASISLSFKKPAWTGSGFIAYCSKRDREPRGRSGLNRSTAPAAASQDRQDRWGGVAAGAFGL